MPEKGPGAGMTVDIDKISGQADMITDFDPFDRFAYGRVCCDQVIVGGMQHNFSCAAERRQFLNIIHLPIIPAVSL